jgi:hypothetical protein
MAVGNPRFDRARRNGVLSVVVVMGLLGGCAGTGPSAPVALSSLVVPHVHGFVLSTHGNPLDDPPERTGSLGIVGAASSDCDGVSRTTLRQDHWKASFLRVWVDRNTDPRASIDLCVSEMADPSEAAENYREVLGSTNPKDVEPVTMIPVPGVPGAQAFSLRDFHLSFLEFAKGDDVVTIETNESPTGVSARIPVPLVSVATDQYRRLP